MAPSRARSSLDWLPSYADPGIRDRLVSVFTTFAGSQFMPFATKNAGTTIREGGEELFLFSSDFPHPEGARNPIERFESGSAA